MKINIVCIGKIKESFFREAYGEYAKRLGRFCALNLVELEEASGEETESGIKKIKAAEGKAILKHLKGKTVVLDGRGEEITSVGVAAMLKSYCDKGEELTFVIGGSNGLSEEVLAAADRIISFGKITFPHQLFRVVLSEQLYRGFMINNGASYHK